MLFKAPRMRSKSVITNLGAMAWVEDKKLNKKRGNNEYN